MLSSSRPRKREQEPPLSKGSEYIISLCIGVVVFGIVRTVERLASFGLWVVFGLSGELSFADAWRESTRWVYVWFEWPGFSWIPCLLVGGSIGIASYYIATVATSEQRSLWRRRLFWGVISLWLLWSFRHLPVVVTRLSDARSAAEGARILLSVLFLYAMNVLFSALAVWITILATQGFVLRKRGYA
ncbi:MAG: hypothetical protein KatS3mg022_3054 [Armatimonadota bacterium]|nr:MAG: hypothetical protein KatS3mg022_3054 [Armatimonadota bacterium]